jgi:hypothetical protein
VVGRSDLRVSDVKAAFCHPPYGLTESMVMLYVFALIKSGGFELALNPNAGVTLNNDRPLPGDRLTAHTLPLCEWNARLDRALLGSRLVASLHKGWNEVLPYARVLAPGLKPATTPDEEQARNESLLETLAQLQLEIPEIEKNLGELAEAVANLAAKLETLRPKAGALIRMHGILELGPPLAATASVATDLATLDKDLWVCPDAAEAAVASKDAICPRCQWHPGTKLPAEPLSRLTALVSQGLADRFQRFKDAAITAILTKAAAEKKKPGLDNLLDII